MKWIEDGWLRIESGQNLAQEYVEECKLEEMPMPSLLKYDDFDTDILKMIYFCTALREWYENRISQWLAYVCGNYLRGSNDA